MRYETEYETSVGVTLNSWSHNSIVRLRRHQFRQLLYSNQYRIPIALLQRANATHDFLIW